MKNKIKIFLALVFLSSCGDIELEFPQPTYLKNLDKIPSNFHGSFERIFSGISSENDTIKYNIFEKYCLIDSDTLIVGSENLIIKHQGNKLFVNLKRDNAKYYNLYVLSRFNYFDSDSLSIDRLIIDKLDHHYSNSEDIALKYLLLNKISVFNADSSIDVVISDTLSVNQINTLLNWTSYSERLKFNK